MSMTASRDARSRTCNWLPRLVGVAAMLAMLAGCRRPEAPDRERPPAPKAAQHSQMHDAIQEPIERARHVEIDVENAAQAQRAAIDAASDG